MLPPGPSTREFISQGKTEILRRQPPIAVINWHWGHVLQRIGDNLLQRAGKLRQVRLRQRQARRHGMTPKLMKQTRISRRHLIQRIAQVQALNRPPRTLEHLVSGFGENHGGSMDTLANPGSQYSDHALMPVRII